MTRRALTCVAAVTLLAALAAGGTAQAACDVSIDAASASDPHLIDFTGDWDGVIFGNEQALVPYGDVYREGTDIERAWLARDEAGQMSATIRVVEMLPAQPNTVFYFLWQYPGSQPVKTDRYVAAKLKGYDVEYSYGYLAPEDAAGLRRFTTEGLTTGAVDTGAGEVRIDLPSGGTTDTGASSDEWGAPAPGSSLGLPLAEARVLLGSPEPLPPNPVARSGLVGVADSSDDGLLLCTASVPAA